MTAQCQPTTASLNDRLRAMPSSLNDACRTMEEAADRLAKMEKALVVAEDVLSRAPMSTMIWPNGMHPQSGITIIRDALGPEHKAKND